MADDVKEIERPFQVFGVLNGVKSFHSGHTEQPAAQARCDQANASAIKLGIKSRYEVIEARVIVEEPKEEPKDESNQSA